MSRIGQGRIKTPWDDLKLGITYSSLSHPVPWETIQQGKSELLFGVDLDGRRWIKNICAFCETVGGRVIGGAGGSLTSKKGHNTQLELVGLVGEHQLRVYKQSKSKRVDGSTYFNKSIDFINIKSVCRDCWRRASGNVQNTFSLCHREEEGQRRRIRFKTIQLSSEHVQLILQFFLERHFPNKLPLYFPEEYSL